MIDFVCGSIVVKNPTTVVIERHGIGYDLQISLTTFEQLPDEGSEVKLYTYLHVREDVLQLFGFSTSEERTIFKGLISVSGIGPKLAQTILSGIAPGELLTAIGNDNVLRLTAVSGVGKKTAQRLVIELKEKFRQIGLVAGTEVGAPEVPVLSSVEEEAMMALISLGYKKTAVDKVLIRIRQNGTPDTVEAVIKQILKEI